MKALARWLPRNMLLDRLSRPVSYEALARGTGVPVTAPDLCMHDCARWIEEHCPWWRSSYPDIRHKKLLEFYISHYLLGPREDDVFLDVAGGQKSYVGDLRCRYRIIQDMRIDPRLRLEFGDKVAFIEGDAVSIALPDGSVDRISCHHSFEHFSEDGDVAFIKEVQRLLSPGGKCCIVPIFITGQALDIVDIAWRKTGGGMDSRRLFDPTATLPGGAGCGNFARTYSIETFRRRVLSNIDGNAFAASMVAPRMDGDPVPDLRLSCHRGVSRLNFPYRALMIERHG